MVRLSLQERVLVVKIFYCHSESYAETVRHLRQIMGRNEAPNESTVRRLMLKFKQTGSVQDVKTPTRQRSRRSPLNQAIVFDSVLTSPTTSLRRRSQQLAIPLSSLYRIMKKDLHLHPYKLQLTQELKAGDHGKRRQFVEWFHNMQVEDADFASKIIFSDEAHFHMSGFVNKQNCRLWGTENPQQIEQRQMHPKRVTVWCGFWSGGVIGPYFFQDEYENTVTVNGERYRDMITEFLWPALNDFDITNKWFQQDGATSNTARATIMLLHTKFEGRLISRCGDQNWPPRSCDLTPMDFFLWGYVKAHVYKNKPRTIEELKEEIRRVIGELDPEMCQQVISNFVIRTKACQRSRGGHMPDMIFHT